MIKRVKEKGKLPSKKSGSKFKYRKRSADAVKARADQTGGRFDSPWKQNFDVFRPKEGDNLIRFLPPTWDDAEHYGMDVWVHRFIGPDNSTYLCPRKMLQKPCCVCDASKEANDAGEKDEAKALSPTRMVLTWILNRDADDPDTPQLYPMSWMMDRDVTSLCVHKRTGKVLLIDDPEEGFDVVVKRHGQGLKTRYQFQIDRDSFPLHDDPDKQEAILEFIQENPLPSVLNYYDNDYLEKVISGSSQDKDELEEEDEEDEKPKRRRRRSGPDEDEEEEEVKPRRRSRRSRDEQEEEPEDEDEEEDDPKPKRRRRKPRDEEEDEDEEEDDPKPRRRRKPKPDPEDEEEDEDEEEEEDDPKPRRRRRVADEEEEEDEDEEDEEEEDEEEEEEKPKSRRRRRR